MRRFLPYLLVLLFGLLAGIPVGYYLLPIVGNRQFPPTIQVSAGEAWAWHWHVDQAIPIENFAGEQPYFATFTEPGTGLWGRYPVAAYLRHGRAISGIVLADGRLILLRRQGEGSVICEVLVALPKDKSLLP